MRFAVVQCVHCDTKQWLGALPGTFLDSVRMPLQLVGFECASCLRAHVAWINREVTSFMYLPEGVEEDRRLFTLTDAQWEQMPTFPFGMFGDPPTIVDDQHFRTWSRLLWESLPATPREDELSPETTVELLRGFVSDEALTDALRDVRQRMMSAPRHVPSVRRPYARMIWLAGSSASPFFSPAPQEKA